MKKYRFIVILVPMLLTAVLLAGCGPMSFTPEAAAVQSVMDNSMPDFSIDPQSIQVTQSAAVGESLIVQVKFTGVNSRSGRQACLGVYEVSKSRFGSWVSGGGGTGCSAGQPMGDDTPFTIGLTTLGGDRRTDPGITIASGEVYDDKIARIMVTWVDGNTQEVDVVMDSFMAARVGQVQAANFDGLDADGNIVSSSSIGIPAPGKQ